MEKQRYLEEIKSMNDQEILDFITNEEESENNATYKLVLEEAKIRNLELVGTTTKKVIGSKSRNGKPILITWIIYFAFTICCFIIVGIIANMFNIFLADKDDGDLIKVILIILFIVFFVTNYFWFKYCIIKYESRKPIE